jgi:hypothetical protein
MKLNTKPSINTEIFVDSVQTVFPSHLVELPRLDEFAEEMAVFRMENYSSHITTDVIALLTGARMHVRTVVLHTTQIFQVLDVALFGVPNRHTRYELPFGDQKATVQFIVKVYHNFKRTMVESNRCSAFQILGFQFDIRSEPYRLLFNEEKLRESAGSRELWSIEFPLDQLSIQRRPAGYRPLSKIRKVKVSRDLPYQFERTAEI